MAAPEEGTESYGTTTPFTSPNCRLNARPGARRQRPAQLLFQPRNELRAADRPSSESSALQPPNGVDFLRFRQQHLPPIHPTRSRVKRPVEQPAAASILPRMRRRAGPLVFF